MRTIHYQLILLSRTPAVCFFAVGRIVLSALIYCYPPSGLSQQFSRPSLPFFIVPFAAGSVRQGSHSYYRSVGETGENSSLLAFP